MKKGGLLLLFCFSALFSIGQKKVLFEKFTNAFCGVCPDATIQIANIVAEHPDVIWISHHKPIGFMDHPLTNEKSDAIWNDLGVAGVPTGMIDRTIYGGNITLNRSTWSDRIEDHLSDPNTFNISISEIEYDADTRELVFDVSAEAIVQDLIGPYRITAYIVEDSVIRAQSSYWNDVVGHPLEGRGDLINDYAHRNVIRTILENHWGTSNVVPDNPEVGITYSHTYEYNVPSEINAENIHLVTMISLFDEQNNYPGSVQNVTRTKLKDLDIKLSDTENLVPLSFSMSPNPSSDYLKVAFEKVPDKIVITDINGSVHKMIVPHSSSMSIDLSLFNSGIYFLSVVESGKKGVQRFSVIK